MKKDHIELSLEVLQAIENLRNFLYANVYNHPLITNEMNKTKNILFELYHFLEKNMDIVNKQLNEANYISDIDEKRALVDFLALMTDNEAMKLYYKYFIPKSFYWS